ncbi:MAG: cytochrome c peroxidase [Pseudomonadales bacterium]
MKKSTLFFGTTILLIAAFFSFRALIFSAPVEKLVAFQTPIETDTTFLNKAIPPIPLSIELNPAKVLLGEQLFHDPGLSRDKSISCASCHDLENNAGTINIARATGINNRLGKRNPPTVLNSATQFTQNWVGKFNTQTQLLNGVLHSPVIFGSDWPILLKTLRDNPAYVKHFSQLYPEGISKESVEDAIATFQRSLITPNSRFDQHLRGDTKALTPHEKEGYRLFSSLGCISCHQGVNMGGNLFQKIGLFKEYKSSASPTEVDLGRFDITGNENDKHVFKVPSLRNVAKTAPYFHDGSVATLEEAIDLMAAYQLGRNITPMEVDNISAFLKTLTGTYKGEPL